MLFIFFKFKNLLRRLPPTLYSDRFSFLPDSCCLSAYTHDVAEAESFPSLRCTAVRGGGYVLGPVRQPTMAIVKNLEVYTAFSIDVCLTVCEFDE